MESSMTKQDSSTSESIRGLLLYLGWGPSSIRWRSKAFSLSWLGDEVEACLGLGDFCVLIMEGGLSSFLQFLRGDRTPIFSTRIL